MVKVAMYSFRLLVFHWPFHRATFYCSSTVRPITRSDAVMNAVSE